MRPEGSASVVGGRLGQLAHTMHTLRSPRPPNPRTPAASALQVRLARDEPDAPFLSALAAFASRTAYANSGGDHLVGWANSSLRRVDQLPDLVGAIGAMGEGRGGGVEGGEADEWNHSRGRRRLLTRPAPIFSLVPLAQCSPT